MNFKISSKFILSYAKCRINQYNLNNLLDYNTFCFSRKNINKKINLKSSLDVEITEETIKTNNTNNVNNLDGINKEETELKDKIVKEYKKLKEYDLDKYI